jgi:hypothetical protein
MRTAIIRKIRSSVIRARQQNQPGRQPCQVTLAFQYDLSLPVPVNAIMETGARPARRCSQYRLAMRK